jgi:two-component system phosphate regulon sensor histidine kinase PhoR
VTFRTRTFSAVFTAAAIALAVSTLLVEQSLRRFYDNDVRNSLLSQARLAAHLFMTGAPALQDRSPDRAADELSALLGVRVTLVDAGGRVIGDSEQDDEALRDLDNHADRAEFIEATAHGTGTAVRHSATTNIDTMYAAVRLEAGPVRFVRLAVPLTDIRERVASLRRLSLVGLGAGLFVALVATAVTSVLLNRRLQAVAETARRYQAGDFSRPARDHGRDELGMVANVLDATARELGARLVEVERERAHTDAILSGMVEGVLLVDADGRLVLTNPAAQRMLQIAGPSTGLHYLEVVRQPDIVALMTAVLDGRPAAPVEIELARDPARRVRASVVPVEAARGGGAVLVLYDITDLRHADQVRRDFVANVSHELRTPLTAIRGYVEALLDAAPESAETRRFLDVIARHTLRMERLVGDLLRLARLDAGQEAIAWARCAVADLFDAVIVDLDGPLTTRRQRVSIDIAPDAATVEGDASKLQDILRNLVENASNYSPAESTIELRARRRDGAVELQVADRGPGIAEADLPRIFERFYRADRSRTRDPGGTGLGLSIARHLAGLHGATLSAANRADGGAIFTLRFTPVSST